MAQFSVLRLNRWFTLLSQTVGGMLLQGSVVPPWLMLSFPPVWRVLNSLQVETIILIVGYLTAVTLYKWIKTIVREVFMYQYILSHRSHVMSLSMWQWVGLLGAYPLTEFVACFLFNNVATWTMLVHAIHCSTLHYVTAPKAFSSGGSTVTTSTESSSSLATTASQRVVVEASWFQDEESPPYKLVSRESDSSSTLATMASYCTDD
jgi:hypothetical protein